MFKAHARLGVGDVAANFTVSAALGSKVFQYTLSDYLAEGPVVSCFPAAFSEGCSIEAHQFSEAIDQYKALGTS